MKKLKKQFAEMIQNVGNNFLEKEITAQFPIQGNKYTGGLMVVGRAINGWGNKEDNISWKPKDEKPSKKIIENIIRYSTIEDKIGECPMRWIIDHWGMHTKMNEYLSKNKRYNLKRSAFWRVIKDIIIELNITSSEDAKANWSSYIVWSNLYKVASPQGGNPSTKLFNAQFDNCKKLLLMEFDYFKPDKILFLTGSNWFNEFEFEKNDFKITESFKSLVECIGILNKTKIVVAKHPQGKNESDYKNQVIYYFNK